MVVIESYRTDSATKMEEYLQEKYNTFKNVKVLGMTVYCGRLTVFVLLGKGDSNE